MNYNYFFKSCFRSLKTTWKTLIFVAGMQQAFFHLQVTAFPRNTTQWSRLALWLEPLVDPEFFACTFSANSYKIQVRKFLLISWCYFVSIGKYYFTIGVLLLRCSDYDDDDYCANHVMKGLVRSGFIMIAGCLAAVIGVPLKWMIEGLYTNSKLLTECGRVLKDDVRKAKSLQNKLKRAVEKELPEMKKHLVVLECDVSRYASLQKLDSDWLDSGLSMPTHKSRNSSHTSSCTVTWELKCTLRDGNTL